jgi:ribulose-phosphate 3-epimerase
MRKLVAPSILSADFARIAEAVRLADSAGADLIHVDVMDGHFVPNITLGPALVASVRKLTRLPLDVHLMVEEPERFIPLFAEAGADWISIHVEATHHLQRHLSCIRELGRRAGAALNPATPIGVLEEAFDDLDFVLLMSVNPGWGGQSFIPSSRDKVRRLRAMLDRAAKPIAIEMDGGIKLDNVGDLFRDGLDIAVAGSAVFEADDPAAAVREFKRIAAAAEGNAR